MTNTTNPTAETLTEYHLAILWDRAQQLRNGAAVKAARLAGRHLRNGKRNTAAVAWAVLRFSQLDADRQKAA